MGNLLRIEEPIDVARAIQLLEEAVAYKGADYVDPNAASGTCKNVHVSGKDVQPGCIVGTALWKAGLDIKAVFVDGKANYTAEDDSGDEDDYEFEPGSVVGNLVSGPQPLVQFADDTSYRIWDIAQQVQDRGYPWGEGVRAAKRVAAGDYWLDVLRDYPSKPPF